MYVAQLSANNTVETIKFAITSFLVVLILNTCLMLGVFANLEGNIRLWINCYLYLACATYAIFCTLYLFRGRLGILSSLCGWYALTSYFSIIVIFNSTNLNFFNYYNIFIIFSLTFYFLLSTNGADVLTKYSNPISHAYNVVVTVSFWFLTLTSFAVLDTLLRMLFSSELYASDIHLVILEFLRIAIYFFCSYGLIHVLMMGRAISKREVYSISLIIVVLSSTLFALSYTKSNSIPLNIINIVAMYMTITTVALKSHIKRKLKLLNITLVVFLIMLAAGFVMPSIDLDIIALDSLTLASIVGVLTTPIIGLLNFFQIYNSKEDSAYSAKEYEEAIKEIIEHNGINSSSISTIINILNIHDRLPVGFKVLREHKVSAEGKQVHKYALLYLSSLIVSNNQLRLERLRRFKDSNSMQESEITREKIGRFTRFINDNLPNPAQTGDLLPDYINNKAILNCLDDKEYFARLNEQGSIKKFLKRALTVTVVSVVIIALFGGPLSQQTFAATANVVRQALKRGQYQAYKFFIKLEASRMRDESFDPDIFLFYADHKLDKLYPGCIPLFENDESTLNTSLETFIGAANKGPKHISFTIDGYSKVLLLLNINKNISQVECVYAQLKNMDFFNDEGLESFALDILTQCYVYNDKYEEALVQLGTRWQNTRTLTLYYATCLRKTDQYNLVVDSLANNKEGHQYYHEMEAELAYSYFKLGQIEDAAKHLSQSRYETIGNVHYEILGHTTKAYLLESQGSNSATNHAATALYNKLVYVPEDTSDIQRLLRIIEASVDSDHVDNSYDAVLAVLLTTYKEGYVRGYNFFEKINSELKGTLKRNTITIRLRTVLKERAQMEIDKTAPCQ